MAKEIAKRLRPLCKNTKHVFMWLHFLKEVENPYYVNIDIPDTEEKKGIAARKLLGDVAEVYDAGDVCGSATVLQLAKAQRSELEDIKSEVDDEHDGGDVRMDTVLISQVHTVRNPIELAFESLHKTLQSQSEGTDEKVFAADQCDESKSSVPVEAKNPPKHLIRVRSELLCDYGNNPELISGAFPCLFPLGLTAKDAGGTGLLSKIQMRTLLLSNDRRFAEDKTFLLGSFDQRRRAEVNKSVSVRINTRNNRTADFIRLVNDEGFDEKLRVATENRASVEAAELKRTLIPLVQITGHHVKWSAIERKGTLGRLYAMFHFVSLPFIFGTISPSMRDSRLAIRLSFPNTVEEIQLPAIYLRTKLISENPIAAALVFDRVMRAFFSIIGGIPL